MKAKRFPGGLDQLRFTDDDPEQDVVVEWIDLQTGLTEIERCPENIPESHLDEVREILGR